MLMAVMDLGSNSFKMTVAQWAPEINCKRPFRILHKERHPIQLGAGVFSTGRLSSKDFKEAFKALQTMQARLRDFSSPILRVVATSAIRDAANGREFVNLVRTRLGLPIEVISGTEEATLISRGLAWEYPKVKRGLLIDIGGGSTEVASFGNGWQDAVCHSFRIGSVRLATRVFSGTKRSKLNLEKIRLAVRQLLKSSPPDRIERIIGSAGTIQSLGQIFSPNSNLKSIKLASLDRWIQAHYKHSAGQIEKLYGVQPSRARVLIPGAVVLSEVLRWLKLKELTVTGMTLRDGVLVDLVENWRGVPARGVKVVTPHLGAPSSRNNPSERDLVKFLEGDVQRFGNSLSHCRLVAKLSTSLYDQMAVARREVLVLDRKLLLVASYLHDIGKLVGDSGHHKHSAYMIRHLKVPGLSPLELRKVALLALYHRKETPPKRNPLPLGISGPHADQVRRLCAFLRLADGLDTGEAQNIRSARIKVSRKRATLQLEQVEPAPLNMEAFRAKAAYFEELFGIKIVSYVNHKRLLKTQK